MPEKRMRMIKKEEPGAGGAQQRQQQQHAAAAEERRFRGDKNTDALICRRQSESHVDSQLRSNAPSAASPSFPRSPRQHTVVRQNEQWRLC